jgi:uracil-DNA glycosylase
VAQRPVSGRIEAVAAKAKGCTMCSLYRNATQTIFGEGPAGARLMPVGEQPGDQEDLAGRPFVGPAGKLLDRALVDLELQAIKPRLVIALGMTAASALAGHAVVLFQGPSPHHRVRRRSPGHGCAAPFRAAPDPDFGRAASGLRRNRRRPQICRRFRQLMLRSSV